MHIQFKFRNLNFLLGHCFILLLFFFFNLAQQPNAGHGLLIREVSRSHTMKSHSR